MMAFPRKAHIPEVNHNNDELNARFVREEDGYGLYRISDIDLTDRIFRTTDGSRWQFRDTSGTWHRFASVTGHDDPNSDFFFTNIKLRGTQTFGTYEWPDTGVMIDEYGRYGPSWGVRNNPGPQDHRWNHAWDEDTRFHYWDNPDDIPSLGYAQEYLKIEWWPQPLVRELLDIPWKIPAPQVLRLLNIAWKARDDSLTAKDLLHIDWGQGLLPEVRRLLNIPWAAPGKEPRELHLLNIPWRTAEGEVKTLARPRVYQFGKTCWPPAILHEKDRHNGYWTRGIMWRIPLRTVRELLKIEVNAPDVLTKVENGFYDN